MVDRYGRVIDYMRISVTDRCNLSCCYCVPDKGICRMNSTELMTDEEILTMIEMAVKSGINKIKITGGEPFVRSNIIKLIADIKAIEGIEKVTITTNGTLISDYIDELKKIKIDGVNINLAAMNDEMYKKVTRKDYFYQVRDTIDRLLENSISTKINSVLMKEVNYNQCIELAKYAKDKKIYVRFIELMPIGCGKEYTKVSQNEILSILEKEFGKSELIENRLGNGPAKYIKYDGFEGGIGFISAVSHEFCEECNRLRITANGDLKMCLHNNKCINLRDMIRAGCTKEDILKAFSQAIYNKPLRHHFNEKNYDSEERRKMVEIGG